MADQQDDKPEEKFEFNLAGEVQGYISLGEARVQAIEYARDNPEFYPPRYQSTALVWEVESAGETEDSYEIILTFRSSRVPAEQAGREQFIFDKTGQLRVRQILRQPRGGRSGKILGIAAVGSVAAVIAAVLILFAIGVLPPNPGPVTSPVAVVVSPDESALLISPRGQVQVDLAPGVVDHPVQLSYRPVILTQATQRPAGLIPASPVFDLSVDVESDLPDGRFMFNAPVTLSVKIPEGAEDLAGGVATNIAIQHFSSIQSGWVPLPTSIDFQSSTATAQIDSLSMFALTVRQPPTGARAVRIDDQRPVQGYTGQGSARLSSPQRLAQGEEAIVSLELGLDDPLTLNEIRFVALQSMEKTGGRVEAQSGTISEPALRVERHEDVPVYSRMKAELSGDSFQITRLEQPEVSLTDGMAKWSWSVSPKQGITGSHPILIRISANDRTYRSLDGVIFVAPAEEPTNSPRETPVPVDTPEPVPVDTPIAVVFANPVVAPSPTAVPVPTALPIPVKTPTPVPTDTPAPVQEWRLEDVLVTGDKVTVLVRMLGPGWFNTTLDGNPTEETIVDGALRADVFRNVPPGSHTVRVFTVGVPGQEEVRVFNVMPPTPTLTPTQTPSGPPTPTPVPRYRIFVNGIQVPALNRLIQTDAGTVTLSQGPKSDGAYQAGTEVVLVAGSPPGFVVTWGGVESERGAIATVEMVADRHITVRMTPRTPTPEPTRTPFAWEIPTHTPVPTAIPLPTPIPVPTATPVEVGPTPTPLPPTPTHTPQPPGEPTNTPAPTATPTPTPVPTFTLTTSASPSEGGTVSPSGSNNYLMDTLIPVTASPNSGYGFTSWSGECTGSGSCSVTMDADKTVTAGFQLLPTPTPTPEPVSGKIVFDTTRDGDQEIYVMEPDGSSQTRISSSPGPDNMGQWSPDGAKIVFVSASQIHVMDSDGSNKITLTGTGTNEEPRWSPDGTKIAFSSERDGNREIYVMDSDGSGQTNVTNNGAFEDYPTWSPDSNKIAFSSDRDGDQEIYSINIDGSELTKLTNNDGLDDKPDWSPDGSKIAFNTTRDGDWGIYVMSSDGSNQTRITNNSASDHQPSWSPGGNHIAFYSDRDNAFEIYTMNADGSNVVRLTNNSASDARPDWGP